MTDISAELLKLRIDIDTAIKKTQQNINKNLIEHKEIYDPIKEVCFHDFTKGPYEV